MKLLNELFNFVILTSKIYNIDESHSLKHSMDVYYYANNIYKSELPKNHELINQKKIIDVSSIIHDMCDKKYMNEKEGIFRIDNFLDNKIDKNEKEIVSKIISTMSYSKVSKNGFPNLGNHQLAYHIVREADLLSSYDFDRCIIYQMMKNNCTYEESIKDAINVFENRVFTYNDKKLFVTNYSKKKSIDLHIKAIKRINFLKKILKII